MKKIMLLLAISSSLLYAQIQLTSETRALITKAKIGLKSVSVAELKTMIVQNKVILIDVRDPNEWEKGVISAPSLIKISRGFLEVQYPKKILQSYNKDNKYVVYCGIEPRSIFATKRLKELGFTDVSYLKGGLKNWVKLGHKVNK